MEIKLFDLKVPAEIPDALYVRVRHQRLVGIILWNCIFHEFVSDKSRG